MNNFQAQIQQDIRTARKSVKAAVSWMTDPVLITELADAARRGLDVKIILSSNLLNLRRYELFQKIMDYGGVVNKKGSLEANKGSFMHTKFYIIDDAYAKAGSYNWSKKATTNDETLDRVADVQEKIDHFKRMFNQSINFFSDLDNLEEKRAELISIEEACEEELTPEILLEFKAMQDQKKAETARIEAEKKQAALQQELAEMKRKEDERKAREKEEQQKKLAQAQYKPKEDVKVAAAPPRTYG